VYLRARVNGLVIYAMLHIVENSITYKLPLSVAMPVALLCLLLLTAVSTLFPPLLFRTMGGATTDSTAHHYTTRTDINGKENADSPPSMTTSHGQHVHTS